VSVGTTGCARPRYGVGDGWLTTESPLLEFVRSRRIQFLPLRSGVTLTGANQQVSSSKNLPAPVAPHGRVHRITKATTNSAAYKGSLDIRPVISTKFDSTPEGEEPFSLSE